MDKSVIEAIRQRCDIETVISPFVTLKRTGTNLKGLCPFHSEKSPSFIVYTESQSFYCFGCGAGGDVFGFVMRQQNLTYIDAVQYLAQKVGIDIPDDSYKKGAGQEQTVSRQRVLQMNLEAAKYYRMQLFDDNTGAPGRLYLTKRELSQATIKHFGLGYSPSGGKSLTKHLKSLGFSDKEIHAAYFSGQNERGYYDYFRGRVMFPIIDLTGNVIAFGGRVLDDSKPKYLNTSDTPAFKKSRNLFAMNYAKNYCQDYLILCEGYLDVITMHQAGFQMAVATLGTALTSEQARLIKKYTSKVILSYDSDDPGVAAANRAIGILEEVGIDAKVLRIQGAKDPDEYIKKYGSEKFREMLNASRPKFDYFLDNVEKKYNFDNYDEKLKAVAEAVRQIARVYSDVEREVYIGKTAERFGIDAKLISGDVLKERRKNAKQYQTKRREELIEHTSGITDRVNLDYARMPKAAKTEEDLLGVLMMNPEYIGIEVDGKSADVSDIPTELGKKLFTCIQDNGSEFNMSLLNEEFTQDEISRAVYMTVKRKDLNNSMEAYKELLMVLRDEIRKNAISQSDSLEDILALKRTQEKANRS